LARQHSDAKGGENPQAEPSGSTRRAFHAVLWSGKSQKWQWWRVDEAVFSFMYMVFLLFELSSGSSDATFLSKRQRVKNWNKGTEPRISVQANAAQHAFSGQSLLSLILKMGPETEASRSFPLRVGQLGLSGLMDGSVSTLAPSFATAFATHSPLTAFLVGIA
jgi:hypothetical protein